MSARRLVCPSWGLCLLLLLILDFSASESADLISRCPAQVPRTHFLKAANWGKCYEFNLQERTWREANSTCARRGGNLVTIREERIQIFILKALSDYRWPRNGLWIGATDKEKEMEWLWVTGEKVKDGYSKWAAGQPSCGFFCFEDCAVMRWKESGRWHDYRCSWLEDYSFICEYNLLPEPTTTVKSTTPTTTAVPSSASTSTSTSSTAAQTEVETAPINKTSVTVESTGKDLNSEYLVHGHSSTEENKKNDTQKESDNPEVVFHPAEVVHGMDGARAEQIQERVSSSSSKVNSGTVAVVVITVLTSLAAGLCIFFIMKRRRRKEIREDNRGIGYENPYYEEAKACLSRKETGSGDDDTDGETEKHTAEGGSVAVHTSTVDSAVGFKASTTSKNNKEIGLLPVPPQVCVYNSYDTPPSASMRVPRTNKKDSDKDHYESVTGQPIATGYDQRSSLAVSKETENCYDEIHRQRPDSKYAYDVPRASRLQFYRSGFEETDDNLTQLEHAYGTSYEENIYESVDNLQTIVNEEETPATMVVENIKDGDDDEDRYVPFMFDTPTESS